MSQNNFIVLKQGLNKILITLLISVFFHLFISDMLAYIGYFMTFICIFIYRNPMRNNFSKDVSKIFSPIDGKIVAIDKTKNKQKIVIDVSMCNTHLVTAPKSANMIMKNYKNGLNLNHNTYKAKKLNNQTTLKFNDIKVKFISGICNPKINFINSIEVELGDEIGVFMQGLVIVELPLTYNIEVSLNEKVYSNKTLLCK